jgi:hypothetical protein
MDFKIILGKGLVKQISICIHSAFCSHFIVGLVAFADNGMSENVSVIVMDDRKRDQKSLHHCHAVTFTASVSITV